MRRFIRKLLAVFILLPMVFSLHTHADDPSALSSEIAYSYNYNSEQKAFATPGYYELFGVTKGDFAEALDMMIRDGELYILTSKGIVVLDANHMTIKRLLQSEAVDFADAKGFFVTAQKEILLTQYNCKKVVKIDKNGNKVMEFGEPPVSDAADGFLYKPQKVIAQQNGLIYVISDGCYEGLLQFNEKGDFLSFFGATKVTMTAELLVQQLWNRVMTKAQKERTVMAIPTAYNGFCLNENDLLYVCSAASDLEDKQVKKLSPYGNDITPTAYNTFFGDYTDEKEYHNAFTDMAIDEDGFLSVLDSANGKIFQYDSQNHLLGVFGGLSAQTGTFIDPVAVETMGDSVYVLDRGNRAVVCLKPTAYGEALRKGTALYLDGRIDEAEPYFNQIGRITDQIPWVSSCLGQAALEREDYIEGMQYFKSAMDTEGYDQCFEMWRTAVVTKYFWLIGIVMIALFAAVWVLASKAAAKEDVTVYRLQTKKISPISFLAHPAKFGDMKEQQRGSILYAGIVFTAAVFLRILNISVKGFLFNPAGGMGKNYIMEILQFILIFAVFIACVWAVGTFLEGKGKVKELAVAYGYALTPMVLCQAISLLLSHAMTLREAAFVTGIEILGILWSGLLVFIATLQTNDYSFGKTLVSLIFTIFAMIFVLFILVMMATLIGKITSFLSQVVEEITYKW